MATVTITPILGHVRRDRLHSLSACHAMHEHSVSRAFQPGRIGEAVDYAVKQVMLTPHMRELLGRGERVEMVLTLEL